MPPRSSLWSISEKLWRKPTFENPPENTVLIILDLWHRWEAGSRRSRSTPFRIIIAKKKKKKNGEWSALLKQIFYLCPPEITMRIKVWYAIFILTFFPCCWHMCLSTSHKNVHTWPLHSTSKFFIHGFLPPYKKNAALLANLSFHCFPSFPRYRQEHSIPFCSLWAVKERNK